MKTYAPVAAVAPTTSRGSSSQAKSLSLRLLITPRFDDVPQAAHRADADARGLELRAQPRDVHLDRVGRDVLVPRRHRARDLLLADDGVDVGEEVLEDRVLALRQVDGLPMDHRALAREVDGERPVLDEARADGAPAPRERGDARGELL